MPTRVPVSTFEPRLASCRRAVRIVHPEGPTPRITDRPRSLPEHTRERVDVVTTEDTFARTSPGSPSRELHGTNAFPGGTSPIADTAFADIGRPRSRDPSRVSIRSPTSLYPSAVTRAGESLAADSPTGVGARRARRRRSRSATRHESWTPLHRTQFDLAHRRKQLLRSSRHPFRVGTTASGHAVFVPCETIRASARPLSLRIESSHEPAGAPASRGCPSAKEGRAPARHEPERLVVARRHDAPPEEGAPSFALAEDLPSRPIREDRNDT